MEFLGLAPILCEGVILDERDGEFYLYDSTNGTVAVLDNHVARRIVQEIDGRTRTSDICEQLEREFADAPLSRIQSDVVEMLRVLEQQRLIRLRANDAG